MKRRPHVKRASLESGRGSPAHVYGIHAVAARLRSDPPQVIRLHIRTDPSNRLEALAADAVRRRIPISRVPPALLRDLCGTDLHQGVVATVPPFRYCDVEDALTGCMDGILILDQLQDPHNFGALLRTAEAAGFGLVVVPRDGAVGVTAAVEKAAAGAAVRVPVARVVNIARTLRRLKEAGYWVLGLSPLAPGDLYRFEPHSRVALVIGAERGLRPLVQQTCDELLSIPMAGGAESLNVSVAGAIAMYELRRRRQGLP